MLSPHIMDFPTPRLSQVRIFKALVNQKGTNFVGKLHLVQIIVLPFMTDLWTKIKKLRTLSRQLDLT